MLVIFFNVLLIGLNEWYLFNNLVLGCLLILCVFFVVVVVIKYFDLICDVNWFKGGFNIIF